MCLSFKTSLWAKPQFHVKTSLICMKKNMSAEHISMWMVSQEALFWHTSKRQLGSDPFFSTCESRAPSDEKVATLKTHPRKTRGDGAYIEDCLRLALYLCYLCVIRSRHEIGYFERNWYQTLRRAKIKEIFIHVQCSVLKGAWRLLQLFSRNTL